MNSSADRLVRYLLGRIDDTEREAIERDSMRPDLATFDELAAAEDELWIDYAQGLLAPDDRALFEARFLSSPGAAERLAAARAFATRAAGASPAAAARSPWLRRGILIAAAAEVLIVAGMTIAVYRNSQRAIAPPSSTHPPAVAPAPATPPAAPSLGVSLALNPVLTRSGSDAVPSTDAAAAVSGIHFTLALPAGATRLEHYPAAIVDPDGRTVWSGAAARVDASAVMDVRQPLPANDYQIQLGSPASSLTIATYSFRVRR